MKLTLEAQPDFIELADPDFSLARVWKGHCDNGMPVTVLIIRVASDVEAAQLAPIRPAAPQTDAGAEQTAPLLERKAA